MEKMIPNSIMQMISKINSNIQGLQNVKSPDEMAQVLLNSGVVSQEQVNQTKQMWNQPNIRQMIQSKFKY